MAKDEKETITAYVNRLLYAGITWEKLYEKATAEAKKRGVPTFSKAGHVRSHVNSRGKRPGYRVEDDGTTVKMFKLETETKPEPKVEAKPEPKPEKKPAKPSSKKATKKKAKTGKAEGRKVETKTEEGRQTVTS